MILVSNTEPSHVKALGKVSSSPESYGCDLLLTSRRRKLGVQRKKFPEDLVASISDGRLADQLTKMADLPRACIVLVGYPAWTRDGELVYPSWSGRRWTFDAIWGTVASAAFEAGVGTFWVRDEGEFVDLIGVLDGWNRREKHTTTRTRSRPKAKGWGVSTKLQQAHFLQGLPGVGPELAERIVERFGGVPMRWSVSEGEMMGVEGVGPKKAEAMGGMVEFDE
ncbi:MAG: ERCC4 domain-containing protein [Acidimicrobiia bacterium]